jgi:molybdopterin synthase catalytic subunit
VTVRVRLYAVLRERVGREAIDVELPDGATVADAMRELSLIPALDGVLDRLAVRMAVNREYATSDTRLGAHDELALIPPVSGGADIHVRVTEQPLSLDALARAVVRPGVGAVVTFEGLPREVDRLDYEAYREMAEQRIAAILAECVERHGLQAAAAEHRVGAVPRSQASVIVAVSAAHRAEAFAGAHEAIDRIKAESPIWKREVDADGTARRVVGSPVAAAQRF